MHDESILSRIEALVAEEHRLRGLEEHDAAGASGEQLAADRERLEAVSVELDRSWDLLRRRRALREAGTSPDLAETRDAETVERYLQ